MHPNEELVRACYEAFNRKDIPAVLATMTGDAAIVVGGKSIQSGRWEGREGMTSYFKTVGGFTKGTHSLDVLDVLANDNRAIALLHGNGQHEDRTFDMDLLHVVSFDGRLCSEFRIVPFDQYAFDVFWS